MPLCDYVPSGIANRARLERLHAEQTATDEGRRTAENFATALDIALIDPALFKRFCFRLAELLSDPPHAVDEGRVVRELDDGEEFSCRGTALAVDGSTELSRVMDVKSFSYARLGRVPSDRELRVALGRWRTIHRSGATSPHYRVAMRGRRRMFWVTRSDQLLPFVAHGANRIRDILGLSHFRRGAFLLEVRLLAREVTSVHRPTPLDALNMASFYVKAGPDGWGVTDDLAGLRPTDGLPEAVCPEATCECDVAPRGPVADRPRF